MNDDLSNKIMERIETDKTVPVPRWHFFILRFFFWLFAALSVIVGSFAFGVIFFLITDYRRHGLFAVPHSINELLSMIPYIWIAVFILFVIIAEESIKHTKNGYKYRLRTIVFASVMLSIVLGAILNFIGVGKVTHELFERVPIYNSVTYDSRNAWDRPNIGRLAGVVTSIHDNNDFSIMDFSGRVWQVSFITSTNQNYFIPEASSTVRMMGIFGSSSNAFVARSVHEWER